MFGISFAEILIVFIVAIVVLGPDKLPNAIINLAKFIKFFKKSLEDAKSSFDKEMRISELKEEAKKYSDKFSQTSQNIRKKLTFEELDEIKNSTKSVQDQLNESLDEIKQDLKKIDEVKNV